jgi:hypothetical protein
VRLLGLVRVLLVAGIAVMAGGVVPHAQFEKNISVTFDGWNKMPDGSYELVLGYLNRNPEAVEIPIGPDNNVQPGGPDLGQPTTFLPGRQRIMFRIPVPKDFKGKYVWTLNYAGVTQLATASIDQNYSLDEGLEPPPTVKAGATVTAKVSQAVKLAPNIGPAPKRPASEIESGARNRPAPQRLTIWWSKFRGPGTVTFGDGHDRDGHDREEAPQPARGRREAPLGTFSVTCANPPDATCGSTTARFSAPGTYLLRVVAVERTSSNALMSVTVTP